MKKIVKTILISLLTLLWLSLIATAILLWILDIEPIIQEKIKITALIITLVVLIWYAYETQRIAKAAQFQSKLIQKQLDYLEGPNLIITLGAIYSDSQKMHANYNEIVMASDIMSQIFVSTTARLNLEAKISLVFRAENNIVRHPDPLYKGEEIWNISGKQTFSCNFRFGSVIEDFGYDIDELITGGILLNQENQIEIAIFSKFRVFGKEDSEFIDNQAFYCYIKCKQTEHSRNKLIWVPNRKAPPKEMNEIAFDA